MPITFRELLVRKARLGHLSLSLGVEETTVARGNDPMLRNERLEYIAGIRAARSGFEKARVTISMAIRRL